MRRPEISESRRWMDTVRHLWKAVQNDSNLAVDYEKQVREEILSSFSLYSRSLRIDVFRGDDEAIVALHVSDIFCRKPPSGSARDNLIEYGDRICQRRYANRCGSG